MYYVYELIDPRDGQPFYIGKGKANRIDQHEIEARQGRVSRKCDRIRCIESDGFKVKKRKVRSFSDEQDAYNFEAEHISSFGISALTNVQLGGGTARGMPTLYGDRLRVRVTAEMLRRTDNGRIKGVWLFGSYLDLEKIAGDFNSAIAKIVERRSLEWVNAIAAKWQVEFRLADG